MGIQATLVLCILECANVLYTLQVSPPTQLYFDPLHLLDPPLLFIVHWPAAKIVGFCLYVKHIDDKFRIYWLAWLHC